MASVREVRQRTTSARARGPADVISVEMRCEHEVDFVRLDAGRLQLCQKLAVTKGPCAPSTHTTVDEHAVRGRSDKKAKDARFDPSARLGFEVVTPTRQRHFWCERGRRKAPHRIVEGNDLYFSDL